MVTMSVRWLLAPLIAVSLFGCRSTAPNGGAAPSPVAAKAPDSIPGDSGSESVTEVEPKQTGTLYPTVRIDTTLGAIDVQLNAERAPITAINFLDYVNAGFYDGTTFHRVIDTMIQGGALDAKMREKTQGLRDPIKCESGNGLINRRGTIGLVRTPGIHDSARAQFFLNRVDNFELEALPDGAGFAVFGKVIRGLDVVEAIASVPLGTHPDYAAGKSPVVPVTPVVIKSVRQLTPLDEDRAQELARVSAQSQLDLRDHLIRIAEGEGGNTAVRLESGLIYVDVVEGRGAMPTIEDQVEVYYRGTLMNETEFENSLHESKTFAMTNVVDGWKQGLSTMKEGGRRILFVPPELAFGSGGIPGRIPGDAWTMFEIELILVSPAGP